MFTENWNIKAGNLCWIHKTMHCKKKIMIIIKDEKVTCPNEWIDIYIAIAWYINFVSLNHLKK